MSEKPSCEIAREQAAKAASFLRDRLKIGDPPVRTGLVLGTGWGETLRMDGAQEIPFSEIPGFELLPVLGRIEGHARTLVHGTLGGVPTIALKGRVHLNEHPKGLVPVDLVRLQIAMLMELGIRKLIVTSAVGSLTADIKVADVAIVDGFMTLFAPPMPLYAGEFCSPEDALGKDLIGVAYRVGSELYDDSESDVTLCGHVMVRGPFFEGRKYDKSYLAGTGAGVVGMSALPEATVVAAYRELYGKREARTLCLGFITNSATETHSHEENQRRAKASKEKLGELLRRIVVETKDL